MGDPVARPLNARKRPAGRPMTVQNVAHRADSASRSASHRAGSHSALVDAKRRRGRRRFLVVVIAIALVVALAAAGMTAFAFFRTTDSNLNLDPSNAKDALVAQKDGEAYYALMSADLSRPELREQQPGALGLLLLRIDEGAHAVTMVTIPSKLNVRTSDGQTHPIDEASQIGGEAELIKCVADLAQVDISHFVKTDADGIAGMTEALGGVQMSVPSEIDDPRAGTLVVMPGDDKLTGEEALILLRASNVSGGESAMYKNRMAFTLALAEQAASTEGLDFANAVGETSKYIYTDWTASDLLALGGALKPFEDLTVYQCTVPYAESNAKGSDVTLYERQTKSWEAMLSRIKAGEDPNDIDSAPENVNASNVTVEVRNGTSTAGAAAKLGEFLSGSGYEVIGVGNTDDGTIYPETLVVYTDQGSEGAAKAIVEDMGSGRVVNGGDFYSSQADVIAIIGLDWMPVG